MTDGSRILCYYLGFVFLVFTVIINNKPRILILMICVCQRWLLWQQAVIKMANISLFSPIRISRVIVGEVFSNLAFYLKLR